MEDEYFMNIALDAAKEAYSNGQVPIGAVLVIDGKIVGKKSNSQIKNKNWFNHAENILIQMESEEIKRASKRGASIELFTTLEPCLQCFGASIHNRLTRIIYACPDPVAGSTHIVPPTEWYSGKWPQISHGPLTLESYELFMRFIEENPVGWKNVIPHYRKLKGKL